MVELAEAAYVVGIAKGFDLDGSDAQFLETLPLESKLVPAHIYAQSDEAIAVHILAELIADC